MKARNMISMKATTFSIWRLTTLGIAILLLTFAGSIGPNVVSAQQTSSCATGGAVPDPDDNPGLVSDCGALLAARDTLAGTATLNWAADTPMSEWEGIVLDGTPLRVTQLNLSRKGLTGEIPAQLGNLSNLQRLYLSDNQLTGELPQSLTGLMALASFIFHNNSGLCAPIDEAFQTWLQGVSTSVGSSCAPMDSAEDRAVLVELYNATDGANWTNNTNWLSDRPIRAWHGVTNDASGRVNELLLVRNGLTGELPADLGDLTNLVRLWLIDNQLTGDIPAELGDLLNLTFLRLHNNQLTGELPQSLTGLTALASFVFHNNSGLCAPIDEAFQTWLQGVSTAVGSSCAPMDSAEDRAVLVELYNATDGANWTNNTNWLSDRPIRAWHGVTNDASGRVNELLLVRNGLTGELPADLGDLTNLVGLWLSDNQLTGELPHSLTGLTMLQWLFFGSNAGLCAPTDEPFQTWLRGIANWSGEFCAVEDSPEDRAVLVALYNATDGDNWTDNTNWLSDEPMRDWHGVTTDIEGRVAVLDVGDNQLTGEIPPGLGTLSNLTELWLGTNQLMGDIPTELGDLSSLTMLDLGDNQLTGEIPTELGDLSNLRELWLDNNRLMEEIPTELSDLSKLTRLELGGNDLTGEILPGLGDLSNLTHLSLGENELTREIPADLGDLTNLVWLWLSDNQLTGELPQSLTGLTMLQWLFFGSNAGLCAPAEEQFQTWLRGIANWSGEYCAVEDSPEDRAVLVELYNATAGDNWTDNTNWLSDEPMGTWHGVTTDIGGRVAELSLTENQLRGEIPTQLRNLSNLTQLYLGFNQLTGKIPTELGDLANLERLYLGGNRIGGGIPSELGKLTNLTELWLGDGLNLTGELPPELSRLIRLEVLDLGDGAMNGAIPAWLGDLTGLRKLYLDGNQFAGEVPAELGNLSHLELLNLDGNAGLLGALPQTLTGVTGLRRLTFHDTGLCAPLDESFQAWLRNIPEHEGPNCLPEPPAGTTERVIFRDVFGREVNETGLVLVDWEGHIANPAMKYFVELPGVTATLSSSEPRLYFDRPSTTGANGPTKALVSEEPTQSAEFHISIFPDRDTSDESHTLTIRYVGGGGRVSVQTIDVHVIDQDVDRPLEFDVIPDFRHDETGMFDDPAVREAVQQAANDFAYFIADMSLDEVPAGEELMEIEYPNSPDNRTVTNAIDYTGYLMHVYGLWDDELNAGGGPSPDGRNQSSGGVELPIKRSGSITFDPRGNFTPVGWLISVPESGWWKATNLGGEPHDLYSIALHEMGHALVFNDGHDGFAGFYDVREVRDAAVMAYYGAYPAIDRYHHLPGTIDPVSRRGAYGNEYGAETPHGRWIVTKLDLLVAQAVGYTLRDTSPFRELSLLDEPLAEGSAGALYTHTLNVVGGIPAYYWTIEKGALPDGLSLDSFTGTISGTPQKPGTFDFTIRVQDSTEGSPGVIRAVSLNIRDRVHYTSDGEVLVELYNATDGANWTNNTNWLSDEPIGEWYGVSVDSNGRVTNLDLNGLGLDGILPGELSDLTELKELYLQDNDLSGPIPPELGHLSDLTHLHLQNNDLSGGIPGDLGGLTVLRELRLDSNDLSGQLPPELSKLTKATRLWVADNDLSGPIPAELGDMANLDWLNLGRNNFSGQIPAELGNLSRLRRLYIYENDLSGPIPGALGSLSRLTHIVAQSNDLSGEIPAELGSLTNLVWLGLYDNDLSGEIPAELGGLAKLQRLYLTNNELYGEVPEELGDLAALTNLWLNHNYLSGQIPESLDNLEKLSRLRLAGNRFTGCLPAGLASVRNSDADQLGLETCAGPAVRTAYDESMETLGAVEPRQTATGDCATGGAVPDATNNPGLVSDCQALLESREALVGSAGTATLNWLADTPISEWDGIGDDSLEGSPPRVTRLYLNGLGLDGTLPSKLSDMVALKELYLHDNDLSGTIPPELGELSSLTHLHLQNNDLTGGIPAELGDLAVLRELRLDSNDLTGQLPQSWASLIRVTRLWVADNDLSGPIPAELGDMANLDWLNLGRNNFSGQIPR